MFSWRNEKKKGATSCDFQQCGNFVILYSAHSSVYDDLALWLGSLPKLADAIRDGYDQTPLTCSLIRAFACHQCHIVGNYLMLFININKNPFKFRSLLYMEVQLYF